METRPHKKRRTKPVAPRNPAAVTLSRTEVLKRPVYKCPELGRTCLRPGAYDAYDLPSLGPNFKDWAAYEAEHGPLYPPRGTWLERLQGVPFVEDRKPQKN